MTFGSLFAGIEGFGFGFERAGMKCVWQVERDPQCLRVLAHRYPDVLRLDDVTKAGKKTLPRVDVICFGSPCQDLSVAGKRGGLNGERSGLFHEAIRVLRELRPTWVVFENVPGLLSSDSGNDMRIVLESFEELGYIVDVDILDSQYFGVAQRRQRVFLVCQHRDDFQKRMTNTSLQTIAQCLAEMLGIILAAHRTKLASGQGNSESNGSRFSDGLQKRMRLFDLPGANDLYATWLQSLEENFLASACEQKNSESVSMVAAGEAEQTWPTKASMPSAITAKKTASIGQSPFTKTPWKKTLDAICGVAKQYITLTSTKVTTESKIFTCSQMLLRIVRLICQSNPSSPTYWNSESSALMALTEYTSYAKQTGECLFGDMAWIRAWRDFLSQAQELNQLISSLRGERAGEILFESPCGCGDFATGSEAETRVAATVRSRSHSPGVSAPGRGGEDDQNLVVANAITGSQTRNEQEQTYVVHTLRSEGADASEDGTDRGVPIVIQDMIRHDKRQNGGGMSEQGVSYTLDGQATQAVFMPHRTLQDDGSVAEGFAERDMSDALHGPTGNKEPLVVGFTIHGSDDCRKVASETETAQSLRCRAPGKVENRSTTVALGRSVRRLMPVECLRLQGFPDDWLDLDPPLSDSAKYRMVGNAVTTTVAEWIGKRIMESTP